MFRSTAPLVLCVLAGTACGTPRDASPMPEPPSLDVSKIGPVQDLTPAVGTESVSVALAAEPGFAPPGSELYVTHLDGQSPPTVVSIRADGSFQAAVYGSYGDEFRFQLVVDGVRGTPVDAFYLVRASGGAYFSPSLRHDCLTLEPGFEVTFENMGISPLVLDNGCDGELTVANARSRTGAAGSRTSTALPIAIAPGEQARLSLEYQGSAFGSSEDTLFLDIALESRAIRYPITLLAP